MFGHSDAGLDESFNGISRSTSSIRHRLEQPRRRSDSRHQTPVSAATFTLLGSRFTNQLVEPAFRADLSKVRRHDGSSNVKAQTNSGRRHRLAGCMKWLENRQRVSSGTRCSHSETLIHGSRPSDWLCPLSVGQETIADAHSDTPAHDTLTDCRFASKVRRDWGEDAEPYGTRPEELPELTMQKLTTEAQRTQSFPWEMSLRVLCASVVRNLHDETRKLTQTHSLVLRPSLKNNSEAVNVSPA